jgi:phosphate uptake regulator
MRELSAGEAARRVRALDALYLNAERRLAELRTCTDPADALALTARYIEAAREYRRVCNIPFRIVGDPDPAPA